MITPKPTKKAWQKFFADKDTYAICREMGMDIRTLNDAIKKKETTHKTFKKINDYIIKFNKQQAKIIG